MNDDDSHDFELAGALQPLVGVQLQLQNLVLQSLVFLQQLHNQYRIHTTVHGTANAHV